MIFAELRVESVPSDVFDEYVCIPLLIAESVSSIDLEECVVTSAVLLIHLRKLEKPHMYNVAFTPLCAASSCEPSLSQDTKEANKTF